jgi:hypothetical protein
VVAASQIANGARISPEIAARYGFICSAIMDRNHSALRAVLSPDFTSIDATGHAENRSRFIDDIASPGPVKLTRCSFTVLRQRMWARSAEVQTTWTLKGLATSSEASKAITAIGHTDDVWIVGRPQWRLQRSAILSLKQWVDGAPQMTETYVAPLSPAQRKAVVADLRNRIHPLRSAYPGGSNADLAPIGRAAGNADIIAMGEGSHGTSEFFSLKDRVFRYLVEHEGVRIFAQETNWTDGENIDAYLQNGHGNLRDLLNATFPVWDNKETLDLLRWMRAYNIAHAHALHFFGVDMQAPAAAAQRVIDFYKKFAPDHSDLVEKQESCAIRFFSAQDTAQNRRECKPSTFSVFQMIERYSSLQSRAGRDAYLSAYHAADVVQQASAMYAETDVTRRAAIRDRAMGHNAEWLVKRLYPGVFVGA